MKNVVVEAGCAFQYSPRVAEDNHLFQELQEHRCRVAEPAQLVTHCAPVVTIMTSDASPTDFARTLGSNQPCMLRRLRIDIALQAVLVAMR